jgi:hypothetical protein
MPVSGVRSSWATSAVKRRSRSAERSSWVMVASTVSAMRLNEAAQAPNSSGPSGNRASRWPARIASAASAAAATGRSVRRARTRPTVPATRRVTANAMALARASSLMDERSSSTEKKSQ